MASRGIARPAGGLSAPGLAGVAFTLLNLLGLAAYLHPFIFARTAASDGDWFSHSADGPLVFAGIAALCMALIVAELTSGGLNSKSLAVLGVLSALAAVLRTVTLPAGANLYFFLVILGGYTFGIRLGFLLGALSFFLSAVVTGGIGPWLPFQMFAAAWMGLSAGGLRIALDRVAMPFRGQVVAVVAFGAAWGLLYGAITNLWFWPFWVGGEDISYAPGIGVVEALRRYWNFYFVTSFGWDLASTICNTIVLSTVGAPLLRALLRFQQRFTWEVGSLPSE